MGEHGRHELKHFINYADVVELRSRLPSVAKLDEHAGAEGGYRIRSLYFDNYNDRALREKVDGVDGREKFRLRLYNNSTALIRLEKKSKRGGLCFKESTTISEEECRRLLAGDYSALKDNGSLLCLELYAKMHYQQLRPKTIVDYWREAYVYPVGNVRVTLDSDLRTSLNIQDFLGPGPIPLALPGGIYILEVKYDAFLPEIIRGMVFLSSRSSSAFSKYAAARLV